MPSTPHTNRPRKIMLASSLLLALAMCRSSLAFDISHASRARPLGLPPPSAGNGNGGMPRAQIGHRIPRARAPLAMDAGGGVQQEGGDADGDAEKKRIKDEIFWAKQRALAAEMSAKTDAGLREEQREKFAARRLALVSDTLYFSILIGSLLWLVAPNPFVAVSYLFGALSGTAYSYGLGKYVETIGGSIDDTEAEGAGIGSARFAFLILLFVVVGKFRSQGLLEIPSILGFFTYQLASLGQGLREIDD